METYKIKKADCEQRLEGLSEGKTETPFMRVAKKGERMLGIQATVQALLNCLTQFFNYKKVKTENQDETEIIDDKKDLKKAADVAERIIQIAIKYQSSMSKFDRLKLSSLIKQFNKKD